MGTASPLSWARGFQAVDVDYGLGILKSIAQGRYSASLSFAHPRMSLAQTETISLFIRALDLCRCFLTSRNLTFHHLISHKQT